MFRSILIIHRQLRRINKAYIKIQKDYWIHHNLCTKVCR